MITRPLQLQTTYCFFDIALLKQRRDLTLLCQSGWEKILESSSMIDGKKFNLYAESAFIPFLYITITINTADADVSEFQRNAGMSKVQMAAEKTIRI